MRTKANLFIHFHQLLLNDEKCWFHFFLTIENEKGKPIKVPAIAFNKSTRYKEDGDGIQVLVHYYNGDTDPRTYVIESGEAQNFIRNNNINWWIAHFYIDEDLDTFEENLRYEITTNDEGVLVQDIILHNTLNPNLE